MKTIMMCILIAVSLMFTGCKKDSTEEVAVKSVTEYKQQADKEITAENMEQELQKMEEAVSGDVTAE